METTNARYAALSYVWGRLSNQFKTVKSNYRDLQEPGFLMSNWGAVPATVKDAKILTEQLDTTFLWIDRLCIIQDADTTKENVSCMTSIYANAYITIVAVSGADAEAGLCGLESSSGPRSYDPYYRFSESIFCSIEHEEKEDIWHTRAWTFQERAVSRRCLVFFQQTVKFECQEKVYLEQAGLDTTSDGPVQEVRAERNHEIERLDA